jgi:hypothetical protein
MLYARLLAASDVGILILQDGLLQVSIINAPTLLVSMEQCQKSEGFNIAGSEIDEVIAVTAARIPDEPRIVLTGYYNHRRWSKMAAVLADVRGPTKLIFCIYVLCSRGGLRKRSSESLSRAFPATVI